MVRAAQFAGVLVFDIGRSLQCIGRTAHVFADVVLDVLCELLEHRRGRTPATGTGRDDGHELTEAHEKTIIQLVVSNVFFLIMTGTAVVYTWQTPTLTQLGLLVGTGVVAGCAQFALFEGMRQAPVSVLAPFEYTSLVWAFILGYLIWADIPTHNVIVGAIMILGAGFIIIVSEKLRRRVAA